MAQIERHIADDYSSGAICNEEKRECRDLSDFKALDCNEGKIPKYSIFNLENLINLEKKILLRPVVHQYELMFESKEIAVRTHSVCFGATFSSCINRKTLVLADRNQKDKRQCKIVEVDDLLSRHFEKIEKAKAENKF